jgi:hypothetical protein
MLDNKNSRQEIPLEQREILPGVHIFKRKNSQVWQARLKRSNNKWTALSTGETDLSKAIEIAKKNFLELKDSQARGEVEFSRKFIDVAKAYSRELKTEIENGNTHNI